MVNIADVTQPPRCDFCSVEDVHWTAYTTAAEITVMDPKSGASTSMNSDEEWAVCNICVELVRANDRDGLAKRSHEMDPVPGEEERVLTKAADNTGTACFHKVLHDGLFWPGFAGRIEPVEPGERMVSRYVKIDWQFGGEKMSAELVLPPARKDE